MNETTKKARRRIVRYKRIVAGHLLMIAGVTLQVTGWADRWFTEPMGWTLVVAAYLTVMPLLDELNRQEENS